MNKHTKPFKVSKSGKIINLEIHESIFIDPIIQTYRYAQNISPFLLPIPWVTQPQLSQQQPKT